MEKGRLRQLLTDYSIGTISGSDLETLLDYVARHHGDADLDSLLAEMLEDTLPEEQLVVDSEYLYKRIVEHPRFSDRPLKARKLRWKWYGAAAVLLLGGGLLFSQWASLVDSAKEAGLIVETITKTVTTSPTDRLILQLATGEVIYLDSVANGVVATEGGTEIVLQGDALHYHKLLPTMNSHRLQNTVATPKGRQYRLVLPDGSKVWLNAASRLVYPVTFANEKREVEVVGEAYFEVAKANRWPFVVKTKSQQVEVLGTHFNVSAYDDDNDVKTSLVEGVVKVSAIAAYPSSKALSVSNASVILKPGQQVVTQKDKRDLRLTEVDPYEAVLWKDNLFTFHNEEISSVMKKVSRWYDVEVHYLDGMAGKRIGGGIPRFKHVEELMDALQATGVLRYRKKGGVIVIMK